MFRGCSLRDQLPVVADSSFAIHTSQQKDRQNSEAVSDIAKQIDYPYYNSSIGSDGKNGGLDNGGARA